MYNSILFKPEYIVYSFLFLIIRIYDKKADSFLDNFADYA